MSHSKDISKLSSELIDYTIAHSAPEDPLLADLHRTTHVKMFHPRRSSDHLSGMFLELLSRMIKPHRILEIGTFTGYGAICLAKGLSPDGHLHTIEVNDEYEDFIREWLSKAGIADKITLHIGDALSIIPTLPDSFDLVFIDGDKHQYVDYYNTVFPKVKTGGFILADNVLWSGKVIESDLPENDHFTKGIQKFNKTIQTDQRVKNLLLPIFDGLMLIQKLSNRVTE